MTFLMLKNTPVYDITNDVVMEPNLRLFINADDTKKAYATWRNNRAYLRSNRTDERIVSQTGGEVTREAKQRLSLSDSYWIQHPYGSGTRFEDITPYVTPFSLMTTRGVNSGSVHELVLGGSQR